MNILKSIYRQKVLLILLSIFFIASIVSPYFLTINNLINLITQVSIYGVIAFGMTFVIISRELDLSVGAVMAFSGVLLAKIMPFTGIWLGLFIVLIAGALTGLLIGFLVANLGLNSFLVTICFMFIYNGLALGLSGGKPILALNPVLDWLGNGSILWVPNLIWIFAFFFIVANYVLTYTTFGRNTYALGGDPQVASLSGIPIKVNKVSIFVISSLTATIGGILLTSMLSSASPIAGSSAALTVISAVVIGGTSLAGGEGSAVKTLTGLFIFGILENALSLINMPSFHQQLLKGILLVVIIGWDFYARRSKTVGIQESA